MWSTVATPVCRELLVATARLKYLNPNRLQYIKEIIRHRRIT